MWSVPAMCRCRSLQKGHRSKNAQHWSAAHGSQTVSQPQSQLWTGAQESPLLLTFLSLFVAGLLLTPRPEPHLVKAMKAAVGPLMDFDGVEP